MISEWVDVFGYDGVYIINKRTLQIKSIDRFILGGCRKKNILAKKFKKGVFLTPVHINGYLYVRIAGHNKSIHRIVAQTFIQNPKNLPQVNHIDGNKHNNSINNLEWVSSADNVYHSHATGLCNKRILSDSEKQVLRESKYKKVIDTVSGVLYRSLSQAASDNNIKLSTLSMMLNNKTRNKTNLIFYKSNQ